MGFGAWVLFFITVFTVGFMSYKLGRYKQKLIDKDIIRDQTEKANLNETKVGYLETIVNLQKKK